MLLSTDGGATFSDLTLDQTATTAGIHPDQHALVTVPGDPLQCIVGDDGGVVRSNGEVRRRLGGVRQPRPDPGGQRLLQVAAVADPVDQTAALNKGLPTLQFQSLSVDPKNPQNSLQGGTQDNGTFEYKGSARA